MQRTTKFAPIAPPPPLSTLEIVRCLELKNFWREPCERWNKPRWWLLTWAWQLVPGMEGSPAWRTPSSSQTWSEQNNFAPLHERSSVVYSVFDLNLNKLFFRKGGVSVRWVLSSPCIYEAQRTLDEGIIVMEGWLINSNLFINFLIISFRSHVQTIVLMSITIRGETHLKNLLKGDGL